MKIRVIVALASVLLAVACGRKQAKSPQDLQQAFDASANASLSAAKPEVKTWVDQAVTALKADDQATAAISLRSLRSSGQLTPDQAMAVQDMMANTQKILSEKAARGDPQAIAAMNMLMMNPPR